MRLLILAILGFSYATLADTNTTAGKIKYKSGKDMTLDKTVIDGQLPRPELGVVTGESDENIDSLLQLRENFDDRLTADAGEEQAP